MDSSPQKRLFGDGILAREAGFDDAEVTVPDNLPSLAVGSVWDGPVGALLFAVAGLFYLIHTGPNSFWLDSAEFVTTGHGVGVAHPPVLRFTCCSRLSSPAFPLVRPLFDFT